MNATPIGARIRAARIERGLSQRELAKASRLSRSCLAKTEGGGRSLSALQLLLISEALDLDFAALCRAAARFEKAQRAAA